MPHARTASIGLFVAAGGRQDPPGRAGLAHFLEHMVFKGSRHRSGQTLAEAMDELGGQFNAFTEREFTCFHAHALPEQLPAALELLGELVLAPRLDVHDARAERQVILEELAMLADDPAETADELLSAALWGRHPLGRPLAGTGRSVRSLGVADLERFRREHYVGRRLVLAAAGDLDPGVVLSLAQSVLGEVPAGLEPEAPPRPQGHAGVRRIIRDSAQAHLVLGRAGPDARSPERFVAALWASLLGGSPSSRLFRALREERGLCYDVGASATLYADAGEVAVFVATTPGQAAEAAELLLGEVRALGRDGPGAEEVARHQRLLLAGLWMGQETPEGRMLQLGRVTTAHLPWLEPEALAAALAAVRPEEIARLGGALGDPAGWAAAVVGPSWAAPAPFAWREESGVAAL